MRVHVVHGIHTAVGNPMVRELVPFLEQADFRVAYIDYPWIAGLETRKANPLIVQTMLSYIEPGDLFIGHSNGCAIGYDLMRAGAPIAGAVFINGALEQNLTRSMYCKWIDVYFNSGDKITEAAKIADALGLVDPVWGMLGHAGYIGTDPQIVNIDCGTTAGMPIVSGHSDIFSPVNVARWGPWMVKRIVDRMPRAEVPSDHG